MISHWVTTTSHSYCIFLRLIYDDVQPNNRTILTYDGREYDFTDYPFRASWDKPFQKRGNKLLLLYLQHRTKQFRAPRRRSVAAPISHEPKKT